MRFQPKTEDQVQTEGLLPKGEYDYEIVEGTNKVSTKGNDMIELKVHVFDEDGNARTIFDYLLEAMAFKLRHAAYANGLGDKYETGELQAHDFIGKCGRCKIGIQKDKNGAYPDKNIIGDYIVKDGAEAPIAKPPAGHPINDEIPF